MKRFMLLVAMVGGLGVAGCNKPSPEDCRTAVTHIQSLMGTEPTSPNGQSDTDDQVRRCRGASSREWVACAIGAKTVEDLKACRTKLKQAE
jgi:hypothetical protein